MLSVAAFGEPVVPEVNWILIGSSGCSSRDSHPAVSVRRSTKRQNVAEPEKSGLIGVSEMNRDRQMRQPRSPQRTLRAMLQFRREFSQMPNIICRFEPVRRDQCPALDLVQRVFQFRCTVARIDVHQDQARLGGGVLRQHPFDPVGRPETDPFARFQAQSDQTGGETIDLMRNLVKVWRTP